MSKIEWLARPGTIPASWNPWTGCTPVSSGCQNCYARRMAKRLAGRCGYPSAPNEFDVTFHQDRLDEPARWRKPRTVFVNSMSDFFHPRAQFEWQVLALQVIRDCPQHTFIILTKRSEQLTLWDHVCGWETYPNLWIGVTAENQEQADKRIPELLQVKGTVRFVSIEPMLGPVDVGLFGTVPHSRPYSLGYERLNWVIVGGETGPGARPMHPGWARSVRDECLQAGTPFFFKKWGQWMPSPFPFFDNRENPSDVQIIDGEIMVRVRLTDTKYNHQLDGRIWNEWPV